jgi:hypothetical protein
MEKIRIRDGKNSDLGWKKVGSGIRDKHPGSATLIPFPVQNYVGNTWSLVSRELAAPERLTPRTAHSAAYHPGLDTLFVYGGHDLNTVLGDLQAFSFRENRWTSYERAATSGRVDLWLASAGMEAAGGGADQPTFFLGSNSIEAGGGLRSSKAAKDTRPFRRYR